jgi:hypothetical protein
MPQNERQAWVGLPSGKYLGGEVGKFIEARRVRPGLVRNKRSTKFEEDKLSHGSIIKGIIFLMDIKAGIQTAIFLAVLGFVISAWIGFQSIRSARKLLYFQLRQKRISQGVQLLGTAFGLGVLAFLLSRFGEPVAYRFYPPTRTPTQTPTITLTPTISPIPSITPTPTITNTPAITDTPTITLTPYIPLVVEAQFVSQVTPNPAAIFSPLVFGRSFNPATYEPVEPGTTFSNPIQRIVALFTYDNMLPAVQWSALWYRNGELVYYETAPWDGTTGGYGFASWEPSPDQWLPGDYEVQIFVGLEWKVVGRFVVEGEPVTVTPSPLPSPTASETATPMTLPTATPSATPIPTSTHAPTFTPTPSPLPSPTRTLRPSDTPWPTATP